MMQVAGAVQIGPLRGPGTLLAPGGITGYTMHRDSSGIRRSAVCAGTKWVEESRRMSGGAAGSPSASTSTSTGAAPLAGPDKVLSHGWGNPTFEPRGGLTSSSTT